MAHGAMGRAPNPHRLLALGGLVLGIFSVIFYMVVPSLIATAGRTSLFEVMGGMMACVAVASIAYPEVRGHDQAAVRSASPPTSLMALWPLILGGACLALNQSIMFSFLERVGAGRGFGRDAVNGLFAAIGIVNLFPSAVAGLLQKRLPPIAVAVAAMIAQAGLAFTIAVSTTFAPYAIASAVYTSVIIFTHPFLFGLTAHLDPSGRTNALTPAMMMIGSALGPAVAGTVAQHLGFDGLGLAVGAFAAIGLSSFLMLRKTVARCNDSAYMSGPAAQTVE
jgi:predicted MFS family arabinose efflux permease